jgi:hypothetical protein
VTWTDECTLLQGVLPETHLRVFVVLGREDRFCSPGLLMHLAIVRWHNPKVALLEVVEMLSH